jgi:hypothetical protein
MESGQGACVQNTVDPTAGPCVNRLLLLRSMRLRNWLFSPIYLRKTTQTHAQRGLDEENSGLWCEIAGFKKFRSCGTDVHATVLRVWTGFSAQMADLLQLRQKYLSYS